MVLWFCGIMVFWREGLKYCEMERFRGLNSVNNATGRKKDFIMKLRLALIFAIIGWFAVLTQYFLMIDNRVTSIGEATIRFFSFFTILTNTLVAIYFTLFVIGKSVNRENFFNRPGVLTAITVYITIVGLVYQVVLRKIWEPTGLQMVVDELLHSIIPVCVIIFWYLSENKPAVRWQQIPGWLIYPLIYLGFIVFRGNLSGFYPYPFVDITVLGFQKVLINASLLIGVFLVLSLIFIISGKVLDRKRTNNIQT